MVNSRMSIRSLAGGAILFMVGASMLAAPVNAASVSQSGTSEARGVSIVSNQSNLAWTSSSPGTRYTAVSLSSYTPPAGWILDSRWNSKAGCTNRGLDLKALGAAAFYRCYYNDRTGQYDLWYSRACMDRVAALPVTSGSEEI